MSMHAQYRREYPIRENRRWKCISTHPCTAIPPNSHSAPAHHPTANTTNHSHLHPHISALRTPTSHISESKTPPLHNPPTLGASLQTPPAVPSRVSCGIPARNAMRRCSVSTAGRHVHTIAFGGEGKRSGGGDGGWVDKCCAEEGGRIEQQMLTA